MQVHRNGKPAHTGYEVIEASRLYTLVSFQLHTGRTHQIRVHAAASELPLLGDNFYGGAAAPYLHLVSCELSLQHPLTAERLDFVLPAKLAPTWVHAV
jgi:23S rRNA pseudouridine1911/1915/1917 synthase